MARETDTCAAIYGPQCKAILFPRTPGRTQHSECQVHRAMERARMYGVAYDPYHLVCTYVSIRADGEVDGVGHPGSSERDGPQEPGERWHVRYIYSLEDGTFSFAFIETYILDEDDAIAHVIALRTQLVKVGAWGNGAHTADELGGRFERHGNEGRVLTRIPPEEG